MFTHERIVTTLAKAKELRPWIEKLIIKAQGSNKREAHRFVHSVLFTPQSIKKLHNEIAPRFKSKGRTHSFTRIRYIGRRNPDSAQMAMIEILGNPLSEWEKVQDMKAEKALPGKNFWRWELAVIRQEQQHYKEHLDKIDQQIEQEVQTFLQDQVTQPQEGEAAQNSQLVADSSEVSQIRADIEAKYKEKMKFLLRGLKRAIIEEQIHIKQKDHRRYPRLEQRYGGSRDFNIKNLFAESK